MRTAFGLLGLTMWFLSIIYLHISLATALSQTMPIFITGLAVLIAGENVGLKRSALVFVGFFGGCVTYFSTDTND